MILPSLLLESLRFKDGDNYRTKFNLKFFRVLSKNIQPEKLHCTILHLKNSTFSNREGFALSRSQGN